MPAIASATGREIMAGGGSMSAGHVSTMRGWLCCFLLATTSCKSPDLEVASGSKGHAAEGDGAIIGQPPSFMVKDGGAPIETGAQMCAEQTAQAREVPVDLLLLMDSSGSMDTGTPRTKW